MEPIAVMTDDLNYVFCPECWKRSDEDFLRIAGDSCNVGTIGEVEMMRASELIWITDPKEVEDSDVYFCCYPDCVFHGGFNLKERAVEQAESIALLEKELQKEREKNANLMNVIIKTGESK